MNCRSTWAVISIEAASVHWYWFQLSLYLYIENWLPWIWAINISIVKFLSYFIALFFSHLWIFCNMSYKETYSQINYTAHELKCFYLQIYSSLPYLPLFSFFHIQTNNEAKLLWTEFYEGYGDKTKSKM